MSYSWPPTVAETKTHLNKGSTVDDAELAPYIDAAVAAVENITGPITPVTLTETYNSGSAPVIYLRHVPVTTVTTVTEYRGSTTYTLTNQPVGAATDAYGYSLDDPAFGLLTRRSIASVEVPFGEIVKVTYTAGYANLPANVRLAALEMTRHLWETQRGRTTTAPGYDADGAPSSSSYAVPNRVLELLDRNSDMPGIA